MAASMKRCLLHFKQLKHISLAKPELLSNSVIQGRSIIQPCRCSSNILEQFKLASEKQPGQQGKISLFRTTENDPSKHTQAHTGLYYTVSPEDYNKYIKRGPHEIYHKIGKAFHEYCIMVRNPAVEILECIRASDPALPVIRYIIYGRHGVGKSMTLGHVMSACGTMGWFVVHIPALEPFMRHPKEVQVSSYNKERADTPVNCSEWLQYFVMLNAQLIPQVTIKNTYVWNKRESTEAGVPLSELIDYGISRNKYATDVMAAVLKELRQHSSDGTIKTLVAIDGVNMLWMDSLIHRVEDRLQKYKPEELNTVVQLRKMLRNDWSGGAVVTTVDTVKCDDDQPKAFTPRYLLTKQAQDHLEPHIPIEVQNFDPKETRSCLEYLTDRKYIQRPEGLTPEGHQELIFMSSRNPLAMFELAARW